MKVLILAPNAGVSLSTGGGTNFALKQARGLARAGHEVVLAGYHALPLEELERMHRVPLDGVRRRIRVRSAGGEWAFRTQRRLPGKPSPYLALLDPRVHHWLAQLGDRVEPDRVWFHDDVPAAAARWARRTHVALYVHYPLLGRSARLVPALRTARGRSEAAQDALLRRAAGRIVEPRPSALCEAIAVNSSVTARVCRRLWGSEPPVWPTYVGPPTVRDPLRGRLVLSVGAFHRGKGLEELIGAFGADPPPGARLILAGFARDPAYLRRLERAAARLAPAAVSIHPNASSDELDRWRGAARTVVSAAGFEPFGLSVLEGMAAGATPIVRRSEASGAWTDLTDRGQRGRAFENPSALRHALAETLGPSSKVLDGEALRRAADYSEPAFDANLREWLR